MMFNWKLKERFSLMSTFEALYQARNQQKQAASEAKLCWTCCLLLFSHLACSLTLKVVAVCSFKTSNSVIITQNYNPEYSSSVNSSIPLIKFVIIYSVFLVVNNSVNIIQRKGSNLFKLWMWNFQNILIKSGLIILCFFLSSFHIGC
jgi:hypothetical protein